MENLNEKLIADMNVHCIDATITDDGLYLECPIPDTPGILSRSSLSDISNALQRHSYDEVFDALYSQILEARKQFMGLTKDDLEEDESYEAVKDNLIVRPLNYASHKDRIDDGVCKRYGDMAIVLYRYVADTDDSLLTRPIWRDELKRWDIPEGKYDDVLFEALKNTSVKYPAVIFSNLGTESVNLLDTDFTAEEALIVPRNNTMISTDRATNGAAALFYPGVVEKLVRVFGPFRAVFMNTTDVMICPEGCNPAVVEGYRIMGSEDNEFGESVSKQIFDCSDEGIIPEE